MFSDKLLLLYILYFGNERLTDQLRLNALTKNTYLFDFSWVLLGCKHKQYI